LWLFLNMSQTSDSQVGLIILRNSLFEEGSIWMIIVQSFLQWTQVMIIRERTHLVSGTNPPYPIILPSVLIGT
jgi:hypothetical protein